MTTRHSRQGGSVLLCLLTAVLLAGCGGGGGDQADPTPSFSPQPTAASSSSSPVSTSSSASPVQETPEAFVRRWIILQRHAQETGDTADFRSVSQSCGACIAFADHVDMIYKAGGQIQTSGWKVRNFKQSVQQGDDFQQDVLVVSALTHYQEAAGSAVKTLPGGVLLERFDLRPLGNSWVVTDLAEVSR